MKSARRVPALLCSLLLAACAVDAPAPDCSPSAQWRAGQASPLRCLMYRYRLDELGLSQATGLWQWRIRRHFRPDVYRRLPAKILSRYAEAFGLDVAELVRYQQEPA